MNTFTVIFGIIVSASNGERQHYDKLDLLNINDVFPKIPSYLKANDTSLYRRNFVDMSKVSDVHFNKTLQELQAIYENATGYNASMKETVDDMLINVTINRSQIISRRQSLPWHSDLKYWDEVADYMIRQKVMDCMLTLVYMARYQLKTMSLQHVRGPKDDAYRLGYLYKKLEILLDRIKSIYNTMARKAYTYDWDRDWDRTYYFLMLHQKALKVHTQCDFYFWLIAKIQHKYELLNQIYLTTPTTRRRPKK